ncbi:MAG: hypothetical protein LBP79_06090 [Clostridiales bacterium]|nr:hypothetical protein [Clostridiales bacterium]
MKEIILSIAGNPYKITASERIIGTQFENYATELKLEIPSAEADKIALMTVKNIRNKFIDRIKINGGRVALSNNITQNGAIRVSVCFIDADGGQVNTDDCVMYFTAAPKPDNFIAEIPEMAEAVAAQGEKGNANAAAIGAAQEQIDAQAAIITALENKKVVQYGADGGEEYIPLKDVLADTHAIAADTWVKKQIADAVLSVLHYAGTVDTVAELPTENNNDWDLYHVADEKAEYYYLGGEWNYLDFRVDLSPYYTAAKTDELLGGKVDKIDGKGLSEADYTTAEKEKLAELNAADYATAAQGAKADSALQTETDPTVPAWAKGETKPTYSAEEVGAATAAQGAKADSALQTETDPTVPAWAKAETKPTYTAAEVGAATAAQGALADTALQEIPTATATAVGGIKAEAKTNGDTQPIRIGADGKLYTAPTSGGGGGGVSVETDPTVPAWAKAETKPTYTAAEVGAATAAQGALAESALQTETDPTVPAWAKAETKPTYTAAEIGAATAAQGALAESALQTETDPTVPAWAKAETKPTYTATEVGAATAAQGALAEPRCKRKPTRPSRRGRKPKPNRHTRRRR